MPQHLPKQKPIQPAKPSCLRLPRTAETCRPTRRQDFMKPLLAADLAKEDEHDRGSYVVVPHRVQGIVMVLAGIADLLDAKYTAGDWAQA